VAGPERLPADVARYLARLVDRIGAVADRDAGGIAGAHLVGSLALGGFRPGRSDVDLVVVTEGPLPPTAREAVAARALEVPCPTRGLELVVYHRDAVARPRLDAAYDVNLDGGPAMATHLSLDPADDPAFWFVVDRDIARQRGRVVSGAPPADLLAAAPRDGVLDAVLAGIEWGRAHEPTAASTVLNAARAWRFAETGEWVAKGEAGTWVRARTGHPAVVDAALAARVGDGPAPPLAAAEVAGLLDEAATHVARAR
jgi:predicted nucleotidyltransferase